MVSTRSPACAHVLALLATSLLAVPHVAAESNQGELAARTPNGKPSFYSTFLAQNDVACCPTGTTEKYSGPCCATGLVCAKANSSAPATCISIPTPTNSTGTNYTGNSTTGKAAPTETDSGAMSVAAWGMWTSIVGLAAVVGVMSL